MAATEIQPLDYPPYTMFHNWLLDHAMRELSPNAWKVVCAAVRQTIGYTDPATGGRKASDEISYSQFMEMTGIGGRATLSRAIHECLEGGYLVRRRTRTYRGKPVYAYALNTDYKVVQQDQATGSKTEPMTGSKTEPVATGSKTEPMTGSKTEPMTGSKTELTKERKETPNKDDGGGSPTLDLAVFQRLVEFGVSETVARRLASSSTLDQVEGWIAYAREAKGLRNPAALVVARLQQGEPAPPMAEGGKGQGKTATKAKKPAPLPPPDKRWLALRSALDGRLSDLDRSVLAGQGVTDVDLPEWGEDWVRVLDGGEGRWRLATPSLLIANRLARVRGLVEAVQQVDPTATSVDIGLSPPSQVLRPTRDMTWRPLPEGWGDVDLHPAPGLWDRVLATAKASMTAATFDRLLAGSRLIGVAEDEEATKAFVQVASVSAQTWLQNRLDRVMAQAVSLALAQWDALGKPTRLELVYVVMSDD